MYGNTSWIVRFLVRCRGAESEGDPIDDSELDMRDIVPRVGETAEMDKLIVLLRVRGAGEELLEALLGHSAETVLMVVAWLLGFGLDLSIREVCCIL